MYWVPCVEPGDTALHRIYSLQSLGGDRHKTNNHTHDSYNVIRVQEVDEEATPDLRGRNEWHLMMQWCGCEKGVCPRQRQQQVSRTWTEWQNWEKKGSKMILGRWEGGTYQGLGPCSNLQSLSSEQRGIFRVVLEVGEKRRLGYHDQICILERRVKRDVGRLVRRLSQ